MCVCTQVSGSVVSNWPLCEFCGHVYCDIWYIYIFLIPQFFETPDDGKSPKVQFVQWTAALGADQEAERINEEACLSTCLPACLPAEKSTCRTNLIAFYQHQGGYRTYLWDGTITWYFRLVWLAFSSQRSIWWPVTHELWLRSKGCVVTRLSYLVRKLNYHINVATTAAHSVGIWYYRVRFFRVFRRYRLLTQNCRRTVSFGALHKQIRWIKSPFWVDTVLLHNTRHNTFWMSFFVWHEDTRMSLGGSWGSGIREQGLLSCQAKMKTNKAKVPLYLSKTLENGHAGCGTGASRIPDKAQKASVVSFTLRPLYPNPDLRACSPLLHWSRHYGS
jgi:hypothetical protein